MKTPEELTTMKKEYESLNRKLRELTEEELTYVSGGFTDDLAERVIMGDYGNGQERKDALRATGYDYGQVQNEAKKRHE